MITYINVKNIPRDDILNAILKLFNFVNIKLAIAAPIPPPKVNTAEARPVHSPLLLTFNVLASTE